ncbi:hypothetical protein [uncultured Roseibium sp.]|uniref:hypothetical protein n=1 Tax=uncultured Roseibium sp. TaxID=1936171 RepID=UPI0032168725
MSATKVRGIVERAEKQAVEQGRQFTHPRNTECGFDQSETGGIRRQCTANGIYLRGVLSLRQDETGASAFARQT